MHDCAKDVLAYHDDKVTLLQPQRTEMRRRRDANRDRLTTRLKADGKPTPQEFIKQGSYAMLAMVQDPDNDYDIDDGAYFTQASLQDGNGTGMAPASARSMVCDALKDDRFNKQPEVKTSCVPDETNGRQFRRVVRMLKKFARSRKAWKQQIASGFTITKLAEECYVADAAREDVVLRATMQRMHDRLSFNLEVDHPVTPGAKLTKGPHDESTEFLQANLADALAELAVLESPSCGRKEALSAWDKVFNTNFFSARYISDEETKSVAAANASILANLVATKQHPRAVDKRGGGRFA